MSNLKFLDSERTRISGALAPFGGFLTRKDDPPGHPGRDLAGEFFSPRTDFALRLFPVRPLLFAHGLDSTIEVAPIGTIDKLEVKTEGVPIPGLWMEAQLDASSSYFDAVRELIEKGKAYLSSGAISHLVSSNKRTGELLRWPVAEGSIVVNPANLLAQIVDLTTAQRHYKSAGLDIPPSLDIMPAPPQSDDPDIVTGVNALDGLGIRAVWSTSYQNDLPDSAFLYVEPGGMKDSGGKTVPRSKRHFPVRDSSGKLDAAHVRNALARIPQSSLPDDVKARAIAKARRLARTIGINAGSMNGDGKSTELLNTLDNMLSDVGDEDKRVAIRAAVDDLLGHYVDGRAGSYEDRLDTVRAALNPVGPYQTAYTNPLATYDDRCIACRTDADGEKSYWDIKLTIDEDGVITPGAGMLIPAEDIEKLPLVKAAVASAAPLAIFGQATGLMSEAFAAHAEAVFERRTKEGRVFSAANRTALEKEVAQIGECLDRVKALLEMTNKREQIQARAASLPPIESQTQRLKLLALASADFGTGAD